MKEFRSIEDVERFEASGESVRAAAVVGRVVRTFVAALAEYDADWDPDAEGFTVLLEEGDSLDDACGYNLLTSPWEGVWREEGAWAFAIIPNNSFGVTVVCPDEGWLDPILRAKLIEECMDGAQP